jgi:glycosyltransferase involved in cell wall biosynthesis
MVASQPAADCCASAPAHDSLVSVYIPTRNRVELLERALRSVLRQTHAALEILVCDDASTDGTGDLVRRFAEADPRIVYLHSAERQGACRARNRAIFAARGQWITGLDDDDEFLPERIERFVELADPRWSCVSALPVTIDADGRCHAMRRRTREVSLDDILHFNLIGNQVFVATERLRTLGGFDPSYPALQDYVLWTRLIALHGPALRLGVHTQLIHQEHGYSRISRRAAVEPARSRYLDEFAPLMTDQHRRAQRFFRCIDDPELGPPQVRDLVALLGSPIRREAIGTFLYCRLPNALRQLRRIAP